MRSLPPVVAGPAAESDSALAAAVKRLLGAGQSAEARECFGQIVGRHQRRALRIAYHYLRDAAESEEVVQDSFLKAFLHLASFREELSFEVWFTRIVVNASLDRLKARARRDRWLVPLQENPASDRDLLGRHASQQPSPEAALLARERQARVLSAVQRLPERQRTVVLLSHFEGFSTRELSALTGLSESTVRVHLFRAIRALRKHLGGERWLTESRATQPEAG